MRRRPEIETPERGTCPGGRPYRVPGRTRRQVLLSAILASALRVSALLVGLACVMPTVAHGQPGPPHVGGGPIPPPPDTFRPTPDANTLEELRAEALNSGLSEVQARTLMDRITRLAAGRLPWRPVLDRTRQGLAKGAPFVRIESVCAALEDRLRAGASLVDGAFLALDQRDTGNDTDAAPGPRPGTAVARLVLIDHTTFALEQGVESAALSTLFITLREDVTRNADPGMPAPPPSTAAAPAGALMAMNAPVVALTTLSSEGVPSGRGVEVVTAAWKNGLRGGQMEELGVGMALALRAGGRPDDITKHVLDLCRRGVAAEKILGDFPRPGPGFRPPPGGNGDRPRWLPPRPGDRRGEQPPDDPGRRGRRGGRDDGL